MAKSDPARKLSDDQLIDLLTRGESLLDLPAVGPRRFLRFGNWFVETGYFRRLCGDFLCDRYGSAFPHLALQQRRKVWSRLWKSWVSSGDITCPIRADLICIRNHLRTFYPDAPRPFTLKLPRDQGPGSGLLYKRDMEARHRVQSAGVLKVPGIIEIGSDPFPYLIEELVEGRQPSAVGDAAEIVKWVEGPLWSHYLKQGLQFRPISEVVELGNFQADLQRACSTCQWKPDWLGKEQFLKRAASFLESEQRVIVTMAHGDLSLTNLLLTREGDLYVLDWETSDELLLMQDLFPFIKDVPGAAETLQRRVEQLRSDHHGQAILDFNGQLLIYFFQLILKWTRHGRAKRTDAQRDACVETFIGHANRILSQPTTVT